MIDFRCDRCGKLLRAPAESAGRQARCPECGNVQSIPAASATEPPVAAGSVPPVPPSAQGSPFANPNVGTGYADSTNPYAAPSFDPSIAPYAAGGEFRPTRISAGNVISAAWEIYKNNFGISVLGVLCLFGLAIFNYVVTLAVVTAARAMGVGEIGQIVINFSASMVLGLIGLWLFVGVLRLFLMIARGERPTIGVVGSGGPYALRAIGISLLQLILIYGVMFVVMIAAMMFAGVGLAAAGRGPGGGGGAEMGFALVIIILAYAISFAVVLIAWSLLGFAHFLLVDRNSRVLESIGGSYRIAKNNVLTIVLLMVVAGLIYLAGFVLCFVGVFLTLPLAMLIWTVAYLMMTGQRVATKQPTAY